MVTSSAVLLWASSMACWIVRQGVALAVQVFIPLSSDPEVLTYNETMVFAEAGSTPTTSEALRAPPKSSVPAKSVLRYFFHPVAISSAPSAPGVLPHTPASLEV